MFNRFLLLLFICFHTAQMNSNAESAARCKRQLTQTTSCNLTPQATEGPYYWNFTIRQNITEGKPGIPFRLSIAVIDTNNCTPLVNALVDLWHCDAIGVYSHYIAVSQGNSAGGNDNQTFFRGLTLTDANGIAVFDTIYPGWYSGRATHIHVKVHVGVNITSNSSGTYSGGHVSHTGQLFFNDSLTDSVALISPYSNHTIVRTLNSEDSIYASANGSVTIVSIALNAANNYTGTVTLSVNSTATPAAVDAGGAGTGNGQMPPNGTNMTMQTGGPPGGSLSQDTSSSGSTIVTTTAAAVVIPASNGSKLASCTLFLVILFLLSMVI